MEKVFLLVLPALVLANPLLHDSQPAVTPEMVEKINSEGRWRASLDWVEGMTIGDARRKLGGEMKKPDLPIKKLHALSKFMQAPPYFNVTEEWPDCIHPIRNQGNCGSGWAFSAASVLSDRACINTNGEVDVVMSPQYLVSCTPVNQGCGGGITDFTWYYISQYGIPSEECMPYTSGDNDDSGPCNANCATFYKATNLVWVFDPLAIQASLMSAGPVQTTFNVFQDFLSYSSGIYHYTTGSFVGPHSVKIIGWGVEEGVNYWIAANSWGTDWGMDGYFMIEFGDCEFEGSAIAADFAQ